MIRSFADSRTKQLFETGSARGVDAQLYGRIRALLDQIDAAARLEDFYFPPDNRFHRLGGEAPTRYALRVNRQYRITFAWQDGDAHEVRFEDYH